MDASSMINASQALSGEIHLDKLLLRLMTLAAEEAGAERGFILLKQQDGLCVAAELSVQEGARLPERRVPVADEQGFSQSIVHHVCQTRQTIALDDAAKDGPFTSDAHVVNRKPRAILCAPLLRKGEVMGVLYLENNLVAGAFTRERAELASVLCAQAAISIGNALLYADLEQEVIARTRELREAQARIAQLEKKAAESHIAGGFAHEMRNALAVTKLVLAKVYRGGDANGEPWSVCLDNSQKMMEVFLRVRDHVPEETLDDISALLAEMNKGEAQVDASLRNISKSVERGLGITGYILKYARVGADQPGSDVISVQALVSSLHDDFDANRITVEVDVPPGCTLTGDDVHFSSILSNLIINARDAIVELTDVEQPRQIWIRAEDTADSVILSVIDTGVGVPRELHEKIFEPFFSTKPSTGTGLGLDMVRKLTSIYDGTIEIDSTPMCGATFRLTFPKGATARLPS
jgi:histidine kinase